MSEALRVANVLLENNDGEVLLLKRAARLKYPRLWGFPGGLQDTIERNGIQIFEPETSACLRELWEETTIRHDEISINGIHKFLITGGRDNVQTTVVHATLQRDDDTITIDPDEHLGWRWFPPETIYRGHTMVPGVPTITSAILGSALNSRDISLGPAMVVNKL